MNRAGRVAPTVVFVIAALAMGGSDARAGEPTDPSAAEAADAARKLDAEGRDLFDKGRYADAARAFERAFERLPQAGAEYNVALSWDRAGEPARAADAFEAALALQGLDETRARGSEQRLSDLRRRLGYVVARRPIGAIITVEHVVSRPLPASFHLAPGRHTAHVTLREGRAIDTTIDVRAGQVVDLALESQQQSGPSLAPPPPAASPPPHLPDDAPPTHPASGEGGASPWPWIALGGAAVLSGTAIVLGLETMSARDDYVTNHPGDADARADTVQLRDWTNVAWGGAIVCGVVGTVLFLTDTRGRKAASPAPARAKSGDRALLRF